MNAYLPGCPGSEIIIMNNHSFEKITQWVRTAGCLLALALLFFIGAATLVRNGDPAALLNQSIDPAERETAVSKSLPGLHLLMAPSVKLNQLLDRRYYPEDGAFVKESGVLLKMAWEHPENDTVANVTALYQYCRETGRDFLYVILPGKPHLDADLEQEGIVCKRNSNADVIQDALIKNGLPVYDVRPLFDDDFYSYFYKTDYHWNAEAGLRAAAFITQTLNRKYGYSLREDLLDPSLYEKDVLPDYWVGEMGKKIFGGSSRIRDDFVRMTPTFPVHLDYYNHDTSEPRSGGFDILTYPEHLGFTEDPVSSVYYYYLKGNAIMDFDNRDVAEGNLMIIKDSFSNVVLPYLSLTAGHITAWDMRKDTHLYGYLDQHPEIQTVMIMYNISFVPDSGMNDFQ